MRESKNGEEQERALGNIMEMFRDSLCNSVF